MHPQDLPGGGPAFPTKNGMQTGHQEWRYEGMTLRDYFAAKAMHQFLSGAVLPVGFDASEELAMLASRAYEMADAMLAARTQ
jgi:hypothetical protein